MNYLNRINSRTNSIDKVIPIWVTVSNDLPKNRSGFIRSNKKYGISTYVDVGSVLFDL